MRRSPSCIPRGHGLGVGPKKRTGRKLSRCWPGRIAWSTRQELAELPRRSLSNRSVTKEWLMLGLRRRMACRLMAVPDWRHPIWPKSAAGRADYYLLCSRIALICASLLVGRPFGFTATGGADGGRLAFRQRDEATQSPPVAANASDQRFMALLTSTSHRLSSIASAFAPSALLRCWTGTQRRRLSGYAVRPTKYIHLNHC